MEEQKIGLIGTGAIGRTHIERIAHKFSGAKFVACADVNKDFCKTVTEKYGIKAYETGEDMIATADIDAVIVTTSDAFHEQYVIEAIKVGKQVCILRKAPCIDGGSLQTYYRSRDCRGQAACTGWRYALV